LATFSSTLPIIFFNSSFTADLKREKKKEKRKKKKEKEKKREIFGT